MFFQDQVFDHKVAFQRLHKGLQPFISAGLQERGVVGSIFPRQLEFVQSGLPHSQVHVGIFLLWFGQICCGAL
jgi:hypothetical protein